MQDVYLGVFMAMLPMLGAIEEVRIWDTENDELNSCHFLRDEFLTRLNSCLAWESNKGNCLAVDRSDKGELGADGRQRAREPTFLRFLPIRLTLSTFLCSSPGWS